MTAFQPKQHASRLGRSIATSIAKLPKDATIEDFNRARLTIVIPAKPFTVH